MSTSFTLNGAAIILAAAPGDLLIDTLRSGCGLTGTRYGCGEEQCGACLVLVDGAPVHACGRETVTLDGRVVTTAEAVPGHIRDAFLAEQAGQCGYCLSGMLVAATALLARNPAPDRAAIVAVLDGNLCRCGSHPRIIAAILRAARGAA